MWLKFEIWDFLGSREIPGFEFYFRGMGNTKWRLGAMCLKFEIWDFSGSREIPRLEFYFRGMGNTKWRLGAIW